MSVSLLAGQHARSVGSLEREAWDADKRDSFGHAGSVGGNVHSKLLISDSAASAGPVKTGKSRERESLICFHSGTSVHMEMKRESIGRGVTSGGCSSAAVPL